MIPDLGDHIILIYNIKTGRMTKVANTGYRLKTLQTLNRKFPITIQLTLAKKQ